MPLNRTGCCFISQHRNKMCLSRNIADHVKKQLETFTCACWCSTISTVDLSRIFLNTQDLSSTSVCHVQLWESREERTSWCNRSHHGERPQNESAGGKRAKRREPQEPLNHRKVEVGGILWRSYGPTTLLKQGHLGPVAQDGVQTALEYFQ